MMPDIAREIREHQLSTQCFIYNWQELCGEYSGKFVGIFYRGREEGFCLVVGESAEDVRAQLIEEHGEHFARSAYKHHAPLPPRGTNLVVRTTTSESVIA